MAGEPKIRGKIDAVLNGLVSEGIISGFRLNFGDDDALSAPTVTMVVSKKQALGDVRERVFDALSAVAIGIDIILERT